MSVGHEHLLKNSLFPTACGQVWVSFRTITKAWGLRACSTPAPTQPFGAPSRQNPESPTRLRCPRGSAGHLPHTCLLTCSQGGGSTRGPQGFPRNCLRKRRK